MSDTNKIDFVMLWVDGNDEKWLAEKNNYKPDDEIANTNNRFRDWENLRYWFRGVEKYANWVNNIFFITCGHLPDWINTNNPRLKIIKHSDFMDKKYLPTFNSNAIELNIGKIKDLSEQFVLFNDDVFIVNKVKKEDFFINGMPCDIFAENAIKPDGDIFPHTMFNNVEVINKYFNKLETKKNLKYKYYNVKYGKNNIRTLLLKPYDKYVGFYNPHITQSFLKSYFNKLWDLEGNLCDETSKSKFRNRNNITQYLIRYFQLLEGSFEPRNANFGKLLEITDNNDIDKIVTILKKQKQNVICINDNIFNNNIDFSEIKEKINSTFEEMFPLKSSFEKE